MIEGLKMIKYNELNRENKQILNQTYDYCKKNKITQILDALSNLIFDDT